VIVLDTPQTQKQAASSCAALSESLWSPPADLNAAAFLAYLGYGSVRTGPGSHVGYGSHISQLQHGQSYFISGAGSRGSCQTIDTFGHRSSANCLSRLPALCTQSAELSSVNNADISLRFQSKVTTGKATYVGYRDRLSFRFRGIKFGTFPKRFTYSTPVSASGQILALDYGDYCLQRGAGSEDCLYLNVYTPYLPASPSRASKLRPVMFWIYGGALSSGRGSDPTFDGGNLASRGDVVVVTINYR
jgi:hypothetical protein